MAAFSNRFKIPSAAAAAPAGWLFIRLVLGVEWLRAGSEKVGDAGWTSDPVGAAVEGFLREAIEKSTSGEHPEVQHWYHNLAKDVFLPNADILAYLVAYGELLVGIALIIGLFTRVAVLFGVVMNLAFLLAGTSSTNPQMLLLGLGLAAFGSTASAYGVDRWVLPRLTEAVGERSRKLAIRAAIGAGVLLGAWLAWITTDHVTWLAAAIVSAATLTFVASLVRFCCT
jgi:thiosulfate dehydrogenase [quinone] large subunit